MVERGEERWRRDKRDAVKKHVRKTGFKRIGPKAQANREREKQTLKQVRKKNEGVLGLIYKSSAHTHSHTATPPPAPL